MTKLCRHDLIAIAWIEENIAWSLTVGYDMTPEHFQIQNHVIPLELYESEITVDRRDKNPITLLSFVFKELPPPLLDEIADRLWAEVARRYLILKKENREKSNGEVIGRISFESNGAKNARRDGVARLVPSFPSRRLSAGRRGKQTTHDNELMAGWGERVDDPVLEEPALTRRTLRLRSLQLAAIESDTDSTGVRIAPIDPPDNKA